MRWLLNCWWLEIGHGRGIYTTDMGKRYKSEFPPTFVMYIHQPTAAISFILSIPTVIGERPTGMMQENNIMKTVEPQIWD